MKKRNYIGLSTTFHDSAIAIVNDQGEVVFAEASERFLQDKKAINNSPDHMYRIAKLIEKYTDVDADLVVAHSWTEKELDFLKKVDQEISAGEQYVEKMFAGDVPFFLSREFGNYRFQQHFFADGIENGGLALKYQLGRMEDRRGNALIERRYDHHLCHAATAAYTSPMDEGLVVVIDGEGEEGRANDIFHYRNGKLEKVNGAPTVKTGSLGTFFSWICQLCGFGILTGEEWKVMGLAPYGKFDQKYYDVFKSVLKVDGLTIATPDQQTLNEFWAFCYQNERKPGTPPIEAADMAYTGQLVFEEALFELLCNVHKLGLSDNLIMGGGCCLNSTATGKIHQETPFRRVHVYSAPADDGNAMGAALAAFYEDHPEQKPAAKVYSPYLGSTMSQETLDNLMRFSRIPKITKYEGEDVCKAAAELLYDHKIIGWVQGRAEFGPRALGNRSILANPTSADVKEEINARVKFREEFRPFAPSILAEHGPEYFEDYQEAPYMERTLQFRDEVKEKVPGVVHANGSGRLQSVKREWNQRYYDLIKEFQNLSGVPVVLNTSFNIMGKPIIHSVEDAVAVFYTTGLDALVIGDYIIEK